MKAGVIVSELVPEQVLQQTFFDTENREKNQRVMQTLDAVNKAIGKEAVRMAVQGFKKQYKLRADHLSPKYTTRIDQILKVN